MSAANLFSPLTLSNVNRFLGDRLYNGSPYAIGPLSVLSVLSVCLSVCLSVTLVYCGQTVGRIKMKLGMQVGLGPGHIVLGGDPAPPPLKGHSVPPIFGPYLLGQMAAWIKMSLGMEVASAAQATLC